MKNKSLKILRNILCFLLVASFTSGLFYVDASAKSNSYNAAALEKIIDGILIYKQKQAKVSSVQKLIDKEFTKNAGTSPTEWYILALCQYKEDYDYRNYISSLNSYVANMKNARATDKQRIALAFSAAGDNAEYIEETIKNSIGKLGIMSYIYGLILLDSRDYSMNTGTREDIIDKILALQLKDGGWALSGKTSDVDVTAMTLQALAPYYKEDNVAKAVNGALKLLSKLQLKTGDFKSWGIRSCESTAQVINALSALGIDCQKDKRFIKNNKTLIDALILFSMPDGSFSHSTDKISNDTASVQALTSLIAVWRQGKGYDSFYTFSDNAANKSSLGDSSKANQVTDMKQKNTLDNNSNSTETAQTDKGIPMNFKLTAVIIILAAILIGICFVLTKKYTIRTKS